MILIDLCYLSFILYKDARLSFQHQYLVSVRNLLALTVNSMFLRVVILMVLKSDHFNQLSMCLLAFEIAVKLFAPA
ncbi:hypothetical protein QVD17_05315 [Tagetes erecta]|uniref:Uncharacterized protein n=1 Tax=Tagetes erecta TaxID=13708 RepID=A0AAD8LIB7_TARER|nr:hypothetical protein QVD17_05315 [Tagetes erecta]